MFWGFNFWFYGLVKGRITCESFLKGILERKFPHNHKMCSHPETFVPWFPKLFTLETIFAAEYARKLKLEFMKTFRRKEFCSKINRGKIEENLIKGVEKPLPAVEMHSSWTLRDYGMIFSKTLNGNYKTEKGNLGISSQVVALTSSHSTFWREPQVALL